MSVATRDYENDDTLPLNAPCCLVCGVVVNVLFDIEAAEGEWVHDQRPCYTGYIKRIRREMTDLEARTEALVNKIRMGMS